MKTMSTKMTSTFSDSKTFSNEMQEKMTTNNVESVSPNTITADTSATPVNAGSLGKEEKKDSDVSTEKFPIFLVFGLFVGVGSCLVVVGYILYHGKQRTDKFEKPVPSAKYNPPKPSPSLTQSRVHEAVSESEQEMSTADIMNWGDVEMNTNPMRKKQASSKATIQKDVDNTPPGVVRCKLKNTVKGSLLFIASTVVIGFLYILSQQVATSDASYIHVRYWSRVDSIELMFYLFVLSAILHFIINAGGGSTFKYWSAFVPIMLIAVAVLVGVAPVVYQPVNDNTEIIPVDRAGCSSAEELDKKYKMLHLCPLTRKDRFLRYDFNRTDEDVRVLVTGLDVLSDLANTGMLSRYTKKEYPRMESFVNKKCLPKMLDMFCADMFREVGSFVIDFFFGF